MARRYDNEAFFPAPRPRGAPVAEQYSVPETEFYDTPRPPFEPGFIARAAAKPFRFGAILFAAGWTGILIQLGFVRQLVLGAPIFEEFAKFGFALMFITALGARHLSARLPYAWLSGASFGAFEHYVTYADETWLFFAERILFHAGATGLSMALFASLESLPDVRSRWAATVPASILHWGNNFGALTFGLFAVLAPAFGAVSVVLAVAITATCFAMTFIIAADPDAARERFGGLAGTLLPRLAEGQSLTPEPAAERRLATFTTVVTDGEQPRPTSTDAAPAEAEAPGRQAEAPP